MDVTGRLLELLDVLDDSELQDDSLSAWTESSANLIDTIAHGVKNFTVFKGADDFLKPPRMAEWRYKIAVMMGMWHRNLCADEVVTVWRMEQLAVQGLRALQDGDTLAAAALSRSLLETTAAFAVESRDISRGWQAYKKLLVKAVGIAPVNYDTTELRTLFALVDQRLRGTRNEGAIERGVDEFVKRGWTREDAERRVRRPSVAKFIKGVPGALADEMDGKKMYFVTSVYDALSEAAHPSSGTMQSFQVDANPPGVGLERDRGKESSVALWAAHGVRISLDLSFLFLAKRIRLRNDVCLTAGVGRLDLVEEPYYGFLRETEAHELCACNSGRRTKWCNHEDVMHIPLGHIPVGSSDVQIDATEVVADTQSRA